MMDKESKFVVLVRHAEPSEYGGIPVGGDPFLAQILAQAMAEQGKSALTEVGQKQAKSVGEQLVKHLGPLEPHSTAFFTSDSPRAKDTVQPIRDIFGDKAITKEIQMDPSLGDLKKTTPDDLQRMIDSTPARVYVFGTHDNDVLNVLETLHGEDGKLVTQDPPLNIGHADAYVLNLPDGTMKSAQGIQALFKPRIA